MLALRKKNGPVSREPGDKGTRCVERTALALALGRAPARVPARALALALVLVLVLVLVLGTRIDAMLAQANFQQQRQAF